MALGLVVVALAIAFAFIAGEDQGTGGVAGLRPLGDQPFGASENGGDAAVPGRRGLVSRDGRRLAVLNDEGLGLAEQGVVRPVTEPGSRVVDAAWFANDATLLVAEGPIPTGALAIVDIDGTVRGSVPLSPVLGFGTGHGMAVDTSGKRAVVTAVERPALGPPQRHLALVDLTTGQSSTLTPPGGSDESGPAFVGDGEVAFTETTADGTRRARLIDLSTGAVRELRNASTVVGSTPQAVLVVSGGDVVRLDGEGKAPVVVGQVPSGTSVTSIDAIGGQAIVVNRSSQLRPIRIDPSPIAPSGSREGYGESP